MFSSLSPLILFFTLACQPQYAENNAFSWSVPSPQWDLSILEERTTAALLRNLPSALSLRNHYVDILQYRSDSCPSLLAPDMINGTWEGGCSSQTHFFYGTGIFFEIQDANPELPYELALQSSFEIIADNEDSFISGGIATRVELQREGEYLIEETVGGSYRHDASEQLWLSEGITASLASEIAYEIDNTRGYVDGGVGYRDITFHFDRLQFDQASCASPFGAMKIRDPSGFWFELFFEDCSGCAQVYWNDNAQGELCIGSLLLDSILALGTVEML